MISAGLRGNTIIIFSIAAVFLAESFLRINSKFHFNFMCHFEFINWEIKFNSLGFYEMKVRVMFLSVLSVGEYSVKFLIDGRPVYLRKNDFKFGKKNSIILEREIADKNRLKWKLLFHIPPRIEPVYGQVCIDELRFRPEKRD